MGCKNILFSLSSATDSYQLQAKKRRGNEFISACWLFERFYIFNIFYFPHEIASCI